MPAVPVYMESPITAAKADGVTPKTIAPAPTPTTQRGPAVNMATATVGPSSTSSYLAAQPGTAAMPAPTGASQRYVPAQSAPLKPTPTRKTDDGRARDSPSDDGPPAPQPGAFPTPPTGMRTNLPPPPEAGEKYQAPAKESGLPQPYPRQMSIPPPNASFGAHAPRSSTTTSTTSSVAYPVPLPSDNYGAPRQSLEHPPGYVQNTTDLGFSPRAGGNESGTSSSTEGYGVDADGVWNTAKSWAATAGKKLSEAEAEVWKRVNGEK